MRHYALLTGDLCTGVQSTTGTIDGLIEITQYVGDGTPSSDFLWRKYMDGQWSPGKFLPESPNPGPSISDEIAAIKAQNAEIIFTLVANDLM